jgi:hypothetical protein
MNRNVAFTPELAVEERVTVIYSAMRRRTGSSREQNHGLHNTLPALEWIELVGTNRKDLPSFRNTA